MNLIIDIGNTRTKYAIFDNHDEVLPSTPVELTLTSLQKLQQDYDVDKCILSATGHVPKSITDYLSSSTKHFVAFSQQTPLPFISQYQTLETIGLDRLAAIAGANALYKNNTTLIIDAGTAITFDVKDFHGTHLGGNISPGMAMRFKALHEFTEKLPFVQAESVQNQLGLTTREALINGVVNGIIAEIESYITQLQNKHENLVTLLSGGDAHFFENKVKKTIFVVQNLVSTGLNTILLHNTDSF